MTGQIWTARLILDTRQIKITMTGGGGAHTNFVQGGRSNQQEMKGACSSFK